ENGLFIYQVRNTQAAAIATMLGALGYGANIPATGVNSGNTVTATGEQSGTGSLTAASPATSAPTNIAAKGDQGSVVVDG
ncbi:hypothetical protein ACKC4W_22690, partial [Aeromonas veronii]